MFVAGFGAVNEKHTTSFHSLSVYTHCLSPYGCHLGINDTSVSDRFSACARWAGCKLFVRRDSLDKADLACLQAALSLSARVAISFSYY